MSVPPQALPLPDALRGLGAVSLRPSFLMVLLAGSLSVLVHLGGIAAVTGRQEEVAIDGGGDVAPAALGTSFADFATGTIAPVPPEPMAAVQPVAPAPVAVMAPPALSPAEALLPTPPQTPPETAPVAQIRPVTPDQAPTRAEAPEVSAVAAEAPPPPVTSPRPQTRPAVQPEPERPRQAQRSEPAPQGNAAQDARRGDRQGSTGQSASSAPARQPAATAGNADAANYPGQVLRAIQRVRQARSPGRGTAVVAFSVGAGGGLASVSVVRSSGNEAVDRIALEHIRRAAPFPAPPPGARRQFSFEFVAR